VLFGLAPAMDSTRVDLAAALKAESGGVVGGSRRAALRGGLIVVQVALSFILLVGAGLLLRSLTALRNTGPGFSTEVLITWVDLTGAGYDTRRARIFQDALTDRMQSLAGVQSISFARGIPFSYGGYFAALVAVDGYVASPDEEPTAPYNEVGPAYFATMGIPLVAGRDFAKSDNETAPPVAVVNEAMATQYWRGRNPVGSRMQVNGRWMQVIGVAKMSKYRSLTEVSKPYFYVAMRQNTSGPNLNIRTSLPHETLTKALVREIRALDPNLLPGEVITMREQVDRTTAIQRVAALMLGVFGGLALLLAAIGLYGVMSYTVSQRTRELGLRMALGADASILLRLVMSHGLALTGVGIALGGAASLALTRLIGTLLYHVSPRDPMAFGAALVVMAAVAVGACGLPAWRASRTDPVRALRF
jgi:predicted permease